VSSPPESRRSPSSPRGIAILLGCALLGLLAWWYGRMPDRPPQPALHPAAEAPAAPAPAVAEPATPPARIEEAVPVEPAPLEPEPPATLRVIGRV